ncbi:hypothetical protein BX589_10131 [Paraburkholderia fungorum]|jgi:hypothetical protein|uniref:hypothetical protein n=1 Tax=Paraburkholderia fungorum TaxID=134537 RepID=UPI000D0791A9|nr:hypothetical protein [Paraburkholderia fungorum]PRZ56381.1 hypothetical protein BX589_10131 [Paraburkholderia fungorum]
MPRQARTAQDLLKDLARNKADHAKDLAEYWTGSESTEDSLRKMEEIDEREAAGQIDAATARAERARLESRVRLEVKVKGAAFSRPRAAAMFAVFGGLATAGWAYAFVHTSGLAAIGMLLVWLLALFPAASMFAVSLACGLAINAGRLITVRAPVWGAFFPFSSEAIARRIERGNVGRKTNTATEADRAALWHRVEAIAGGHRYLWVAIFAVALSPVIFSVGARVYAHNGADVVTAAPAGAAAQVAFSDPQVAKALAQQAAQNANRALEAAQTPDEHRPRWLQEQAMRATPQVSGAQIVRTVPAVFDGVFRPAGLWIVPPRGLDPRLADFVAVDSWFVPFYTNESCRSLRQDAAARDDIWLRDHTLTLAPDDTTRREFRERFAQQTAAPQPVIRCIGEPILVHRKDAVATGGKRSYGMNFLKRGLLVDLSDWSDTLAILREHPVALYAALRIRFYRVIEDLKDLEKI